MQPQVIYLTRHSLHLPVNALKCLICQVFLGIMSPQLGNPFQWSHVLVFMSSAQALENKGHQVVFIFLKSPCILYKYLQQNVSMIGGHASVVQQFEEFCISQKRDSTFCVCKLKDFESILPKLMKLPNNYAYFNIRW